MNIYLIDGVSGSGKTTVCEELIKRGYYAIEADEKLAAFIDPKTGLPTDDHSSENWHWDKDKFNTIIKEANGKDIFICGGAINKPDFLHLFTKIFTLNLDDETLKERLSKRANNEYGTKLEELAFQLRENRLTLQYSKERGAILIDATKPVHMVVEEILKHIT
jgi:broad-specificity NMP kinase